MPTRPVLLSIPHPPCSYDQIMLLMEGAIKQGVKRIRLHVLSGKAETAIGVDVAFTCACKQGMMRIRLHVPSGECSRLPLSQMTCYLWLKWDGCE